MSTQLYVFNRVNTLKSRVSQRDRVATARACLEPAVEPDHPERHDLWEPIVIARDSALTENICVGVCDCARPEIWPNIFICGRKKEERGEKRGRVVGRGCSGVHIIMGPTTEKSETSRRELHERRRGTCVRTRTRVCVTRGRVWRGPPALVTSYFVPQRTARGDYRLTITSVSGIPVTPSFITTYRSPTDYA